MVTKRKGNQSELAHLSWDWINVGDGAKMLKISYEEERKKEVRTLGDLYMQSFFPKLSGVGYKSCLIYVELGVSWDSWFLRLKWNCINPKWHIPVFLKICAASRGCGFPHSSFTLMSCLGILPSFLLASRPGLLATSVMPSWVGHTPTVPHLSNTSRVDERGLDLEGVRAVAETKLTTGRWKLWLLSYSLAPIENFFLDKISSLSFGLLTCAVLSISLLRLSCRAVPEYVIPSSFSCRVSQLSHYLSLLLLARRWGLPFHNQQVLSRCFAKQRSFP